MRHRHGPADDYYTTYYRSYRAQNPKRKLDHYLTVVESNLDSDAPQLLDFGCGPGLFLEHLARRRPDWELFGADVSPEPLQDLRAELGDRVAAEQLTGKRPFDGVSFDVITAWDVLEHVPDPAVSMSSIKSWLKPGGHLLFVVPVYDGPTRPLITALDRDPTHTQKRGRGFWLDQARNTFSDVVWHGIFRYLVTPNWYLHAPTRRFRNITPAILVVCRGENS